MQFGLGRILTFLVLRATLVLTIWYDRQRAHDS